MTFSLDVVAPAVAARAETWSRLGLVWRTGPISPNYGKPVVSSEFEAAAWLAEIIVWATGEAELSTIRLSDDRTVNKHYDLASRDDLEVLLDELVDLMTDDRLPPAAVVGHWPARPGTTNEA